MKSKVLKKIKNIIQSTEGFSELVSTLVGLMLITCMLVISITFINVVNQQVILNEFANQMIEIACDNGDIDSTETLARYTELKETLGVDADIEITGSSDGFYDGEVQYGDTITVTMSSELEINLLGFEQTLEFTITKTGRSQVYWK